MRKFGIVRAIALFIPSFFVMGALAGCSSSSTDGGFDRSETSEISEAVYNEAVKSSETIEMSRGFNDPGLTGKIYFSSIEIWDSFFFKATFDSDLEPFFGEGFAGSEVNVVVAYLCFRGGNLPSSGSGHNFCEDMIILEHDGAVQGFLNPEGIERDSKPSYSGTVDVRFSTHMFLTKDAIVAHYDDGDVIYSFDVAKSAEDGISLACSSEVAGEWVASDVACSAVSGSYAQLAQGAVVDLVDDSEVEEKTVTATIAAVAEDGSLSVTSEDAPTLKTVTYLGVAYADGRVGDLSAALKPGAGISVSYYQRYASYEPVNVFSNIIYIL